MLCNDGTSVFRSEPAPAPAPVVEEPLASTSPAIPVVDELEDEDDDVLLPDDELLGEGEL